ncbi:MAG TPA: zinc metallopeptidase [Clostridia bacterium]|nr:zinc metallopeptidase [Clostridia bacterium]
MFGYGYGYGLDPTFILILPAIILAAYAQSKVNSTFNKYLRVRNSYGHSGFEVARRILDLNGLRDVPVELVRGKLSDHYDPRTRVLRLSQEVYSSNSLASVGVAAHECGHAIQHSEGYAPLIVRNAIAPVASFGSQAAWLFVIGGFALSWMNLINIGILLYTAAVAFQVITLPVEFNASSRAIALLEGNGLVPPDEIGPAKEVLRAAALTYVAATLAAVLQLVRLLILRSRRD